MPGLRKLLMAVRAQVELYHVPDWFAPHLQQAFPDLEIVTLEGYEKVDEHLPDTEIYVGWSLPARKLPLAHNLRWMHSLMTGVGQLCYPEMAASPITITNAATVHAVPVAEHAIALMFAVARRLPSAHASQAAREWGLEKIWNQRPRPFELNGLTLGLVGLGAIGKEVAARARALGMRVVAVRRRPELGGANVDAVYGPDELARLLAESDIVVLAAPVTAATRHLIGQEQFDQMKLGAVLINVSRGALIDEAALCYALTEGELRAAALDVMEHEPLPPDSPLWDAPNLLLTPHISAATERLWPRHFELLCENLRRYFEGRPLLNVVDKEAGY